jgi:hypothetical protein
MQGEEGLDCGFGRNDARSVGRRSFCYPTSSVSRQPGATGYALSALAFHFVIVSPGSGLVTEDAGRENTLS